MRMSDWSSDVCSSDLHDGCAERRVAPSAFELMHQLAHRAVDVAIAVAQFLDAADRVDHGRMVAPTELAADLGQRPRRQPFGEIHRDLARPRHHARAPGGDQLEPLPIEMRRYLQLDLVERAPALATRKRAG